MVTEAVKRGLQQMMAEYYVLSGTNPDTVLSVLELAMMAAKTQEMFNKLMKDVQEREGAE